VWSSRERLLGHQGKTTQGHQDAEGGSAGYSTGLQQDVLMGRSAYSLTAVQYAGEQTMAGEDA